MKRLVLMLLVCTAAFCQSQPVFFYAGSDLTYVCESKNQTSNITSTYSINGGGLTSIAISANVATFTTPSAHQLYDGARVTVTGSTAGAIDGTYTIVTIPSTTTFTANITASNATHTEAGLQFTTKSPLLNTAYWKITVQIFESSVLQSVFVAGQNYDLKCSDRALYK